MTHEQIQALKKEIFAEADKRYMHVSECNKNKSDIETKFANDDKRIDLLMQKMSTWDKLLWAIATASVGALVVAFFDLITK